MKSCRECGKPEHAKGLCRNHYSYQWRANNREKFLESQKNSSRSYYIRNREKRKSDTVKWQRSNPMAFKRIQERSRERNKEKRNSYNRDYYRRNKAACLAASARWSENNKDKRCAYVRKYYENHLQLCRDRAKKYREKPLVLHTRKLLQRTYRQDLRASYVRRVLRQNGWKNIDGLKGLEGWKKASLLIKRHFKEMR